MRLHSPTVRPLGAAVLALAGLGLLSACSTGGGGGTPLSFSVGECLNDSDLTGEVRDVPRVDCSEPHDSEVYHVFDAVGKGADEMYPDDDDLASQADEGCAEAFAGFVGVDISESRLNYASYTPLLSSWYEDHGREISCVVFDPDGQTTGSLENAAQ
ncbi:septum formation family protein [Herbiconiux sp.]|uniref:septum formation family protein n=1 Tax=Herbiconiux sp. TaxID=1871186 RepID=UPI0025C46FD5|nr:septum formation family protein [Herbiconiux sp.]